MYVHRDTELVAKLVAEQSEGPHSSGLALQAALEDLKEKHPEGIPLQAAKETFGDLARGAYNIAQELVAPIRQGLEDETQRLAQEAGID